MAEQYCKLTAIFLAGLLQECESRGEVAVVCCHLPVDPAGLPTPTCLLWNYTEVRKMETTYCMLHYCTVHCLVRPALELH